MNLRITNKRNKESVFKPEMPEEKESRQWLLVSIISLLLLVGFSIHAKAQIAVSNPGEYTVLGEGNAMINDAIKSQMKKQKETVVIENIMIAKFAKIKKWEQQYNKYLKTVSGYASALKAATHIYDDGMRILFTLNKVRKAINNNPQGVIATLSINNLYMDTVSEFVTIGNLLKDAIAKGGPQNMLTGADRSKTLWALEDRLSSFSHNLQLLYYSIRHYKMVDVWNRATAGMIKRDKAQLAEQSLSNWKRCAKEVSLYSK